MRPHDPRALLTDLAQDFSTAASEVVPWFLSQMPRGYFEDTSPEDQRWHLRTVIAAKSSGVPVDLRVYSADGGTLTAILEGNRPGVLAEIVEKLSLDRKLRAAKVHSSLDGRLIVDTFEFGDQPLFDPTHPAQAAKRDAILAWAKDNAKDIPGDALRRHIDNCPASYVLTVTPARLTSQWRMIVSVSGTDGARVEIEPDVEARGSRITLVVANARTRTTLERSASILARARINIVRAYLDDIRDQPHGSVIAVGYVVQDADGGPIDPASDMWKRVAHELLRAKWVDHTVIELEKKIESLDLDAAELFTAFAALAHQRLVEKDPVAFGRDRVWRTLESELAFTRECIALFIRRFDPAQDLADAEFEHTLERLHAEAKRRATSENIQTILTILVDAVAAVRRTNFFVPGRFALALRLDPDFLVAPGRPERPFGVFFVHGRGFNGFHVRFKEIARGGLRMILPSNPAQYERATETLYDEAYKLAFTQQQKNKDIPEGGAKAAVVVEVPSDVNRCVKAFADSILDLITPEPTTKSRVRDRLGLQEFIYLGPDENITPQHIEWIVARAHRRGYPLARAFMSSKPNAGINHKVYGVTSEGVNVFLELALRSRGIDPRTTPFTVKITGGPDGDVAGNMIRILDRDYGSNARIVGIGDGSGCGEDPEGLDHAELLRLFRAGLPIGSFDRSKLSRHGRVVLADTAEGAQLRNTLHNRLVTDAFVPGGGRPDTINERNWRDFLTAEGKPSSGVIVEGANLFITPAARVELSNAGVLIIRDSSANKCGVICSSYEIQASMLLDDAAFLKIKDQYVEEVLEKLRRFARWEGTLLLAEARRRSRTPLTELATRVSKTMNSAADLVHKAVETWSPDDPLYRSIVLEHVPDILSTTVGDRLFRDLPRPYLDWLVSKSLSSRLVYREGLDFFEHIEADSIGPVVHRYMEKESELRRMVDAVRASGIPDAERAARIVERVGARAETFEI